MKHKKLNKWLYVVSYTYITLVIFILPAYSYDGYSLITNTTSQLGAQASPFAWVMNSAFIVMGVSIILLFTKDLSHQRYELLLRLFALCFILVAIFQHEPGIEGVAYNHTEAMLHSVFATIMGVAISIFAVSKAIQAKITRDRTLAILAFASASGLSFLMYASPEYAGLLQRTMFISMLGWIGYLPWSSSRDHHVYDP